MKKTALFLVVILFAGIANAQKQNKKSTHKQVVNIYAEIDDRAKQIPDSITKSTSDLADYIDVNFTSLEEKIRATFFWVATYFEYDIDNMFALNFYEKKEDKIAKCLNTKKGICESYALIFNEICTKMGFKAYLISGYTKQDGFVSYLPHAWNAVYVDTGWFLFDPTWGSGYIDAGKFVKQINNNYYKVKPELLIDTHMPFDHLWQFLNHPVTNKEFADGNTVINYSKPFFDYMDTIFIYEQLSEMDKMFYSVRRIEQNGVNNSLIFNRLKDLKVLIQNLNIEAYNKSVVYFNQGINNLNQFIQYRNNQFIPIKPDSEIQNMIDSVSIKFSLAKNKLNEVAHSDEFVTPLVATLRGLFQEARTHLEEQQEFLASYFPKGKLKRKTMFFKYSWMGLPLN